MAAEAKQTASVDHYGAPIIPDPTPLSTALVMRENAALKELIFTRFDSMDEAVRLVHENLTRVPTEVDKAISHLKELTDEKFANVQTQFKERDTRVDQTAKDTKVAVDAALQTAEKAVAKQNDATSASMAKSESATTKQIDQQGALIFTSTNAINDKIEDMKQRLTRVEANWSTIAAVVAIFLSLGSIVVPLVTNGKAATQAQQYATPPGYVLTPAPQPAPR